LTKKEIEILKRGNVKVVHNPCSNMKLASGIAPVPELIDEGVCVALGTDGPASNNRLDLFQEMKTAALLHKISKMDPRVMPAERILEMATLNGAEALGLEKEIGSLEIGKKADIIIINLEKPHFQPIISGHSLVSHLVYSATGDDVETVLINGEIVMENRRILTVDEAEVLNRIDKLKCNLG
jgi:5-methylthioadenosine/S-adenosylhomocysteine deaminase